MGYQRKTPRFDVNFGSTFAGELLAGRGTVTNLSLGGCSIESTMPIPPRSTVGLKIALPDSPWPLEVERAVVRWVRGNRFGLEFDSLSESETTRLQQLIQDLDQGPLVVMHRPAY
ncbi:MAG: PilZ domain-containing protein [Nitrospira sp.]